MQDIKQPILKEVGHELMPTLIIQFDRIRRRLTNIIKSWRLMETRESYFHEETMEEVRTIENSMDEILYEHEKELGKVASKSSEDAKVSIRSHRRFGIDEISKLKDENSADEIKRLESKVQELTDKYVNKIDELLLVKQNELLEV